MCYDMCLRALDDALQTFGSMRYRRAGDEQAGPAAEAEVATLVEQLRGVVASTRCVTVSTPRGTIRNLTCDRNS